MKVAKEWSGTILCVHEKGDNRNKFDRSEEKGAYVGASVSFTRRKTLVPNQFQDLLWEGWLGIALFLGTILTVAIGGSLYYLRKKKILQNMRIVRKHVSISRSFYNAINFSKTNLD